MEILIACCCGIDVHKKMLVACLRTVDSTGRMTKETRTFSTMTEGLLALADWLTAAGCTHVAMESTGVYWKQSLTSCMTASRCWWSMPSI